MVKIHLLKEDQIIACNLGANLYEVLAAAGFMDAPCGGTGLCGKCKVRVESREPIPVSEAEAAFFTPEQIKSGWRLACRYQVESDIQVELWPRLEMNNIVSQGYIKDFVLAPLPFFDTEGQQAPDFAKNTDLNDSGHYGVAIDIGTTTVVASLIDLDTGQELESLACLNGQNGFGQDVLSRIHYAASHARGTEILHKTIIKDLSRLITALCQRHHLPTDAIYAVSIAGNTTMIHLLAGINPASMGRSPYIPAFQGALTLNGLALGLPLSSLCRVYCLPAVSAFVGGDITGGILACDLENAPGKTLFIDIGTNGEIVLADGERLWACSCAAGPALEGMNISCGMRAAAGAIEDVVIRRDTVQYTTIGGKAATGICGSGLLAAIAAMRRAGIINKSGRLQPHPLVETVAGKKRFAIDAGLNLYITQHDIRQVQLAKAAILSGVYALLAHAGLETGSLSKVLVAGQFGAHLQAESLTGSGIMPPEWRHLISYGGNTSKSGALLCLLSQPERTVIETLAKKIQYIELSQLSGYENLFVQCMEFKAPVYNEGRELD